jgi:hypothetical protein
VEKAISKEKNIDRVVRLHVCYNMYHRFSEVLNTFHDI